MSGDELVRVTRVTWEAGRLSRDSDTVVSETPVALVYNGVSHVVTMATPTHLDDLALGFSLSEGILESPEQLLDCELHRRERGLELAMSITSRAFDALRRRRRNLTGRTGCGLCGLESLEQAIPPLAKVDADYTVSHPALQRAVASLVDAQTLRRRTGGVHGAAWCDRAGTIELVREDVGRHNALDKLLGALRRGKNSVQGFVLVTSRASYEMVAKVASCRIPLLAAVSAPTSLAVQVAEEYGVTLAGYAQPGRQAVYTHPQRMTETDRQ